jgi:Asp-tRNA(Asn)/Glu-tRNA(Gln) amidotransferase A subunit family amidase
MADELYKLTAAEALALMRKGEISSEALTRSCLSRIEAREPNVGAWEYLDPGLALKQARARDAFASRALAGDRLHGIPVGIKDICDTADMPTCYGSRTWLQHRPAVDAVCVANIRRSGGVILGKTVTTEFAGRYAGKTANPHDMRRTPGGSSSGSAAAVADCMVPLAIGTQTGGSIIRPAAYCGVFGYKPTFGHISFEGIHHGAETFDTVGCMARSLEDIKLCRSSLMGFLAAELHSPPAIDRSLRIGYCRTSKWMEADATVRDLIDAAASRLASAGANITEVVLPDEFETLYELTPNLFAVEYSRAVAPERMKEPENLSSAIMAMIESAEKISPESYIEGLERVDTLRSAIGRVLEPYDAILTPSTGSEAPLGHESTGPMTFTLVWQVLSLPCLTLPAFKGPENMPVGVQLVGRRHKDRDLLEHADWVWQQLN